ncbi:SDR family oxidoreductase [Dactylosporangium sp. CA-092794]|uniref:SDR family oxidoreductase n=1 Tax=Dactylosporangium sp. CA-092794 TaxID=3239929 RepID=UPI003D935B72
MTNRRWTSVTGRRTLNPDSEASLIKGIVVTSTVLITGCSSGFGRAAAAKFLAEGWNVVATLRDPGAWTGTGSERLLVHKLDVRDDDSVNAAVAAADARFGRLDVVVNNAGIGLLSVFEATPAVLIEEVFDTNVFGPMRVIRAALPLFHRAGGGSIVNLSSGTATVPMPFQAVYSASKGALYNFSEGLTHELASLNVRVRTVEPGFVPGSNFFTTTYERFAGIAVPESYRSAVEATLAGFRTEPPAGFLATVEQVADAIFTAATEPAAVLRLRVGEDSVALGEARTLSAAEYEQWRRDFFSR